jgi:eukaryotic-like serine/threonine-protein kinase
MVWTAPTGTLFSSPVVAAGRVFVGGGPEVYALDAATGDTIWASHVASPGAGVWASPALAQGKMFIASNDAFGPNTYALDAETGLLLWEAYNPIEVTLASPAVAYGLVYLGSNDRVFTAHDAGTGAIVWRKDVQSYSSSPVVVNGMVYVGSFNGKVSAFGLPD